MKISNPCVVSFHYTLTSADGDELDSSAGRDPLTYLHGMGGIIEGLQRELEGKAAGDDFVAVVAPEDAYGAVSEELIQEVPLDMLTAIENLAVGMRLQSQGQDGAVHNLVVDAVGDTTATLNGNHPLAGETLHFAVKVETVREATAEELEHGHAH